MWQSLLAVVHLRSSLPLAGSVPIPYHHLSHYNNVNVEVSGGDGALVRKLAFSGGCASGLVKKCKVHTHWNCV